MFRPQLQFDALDEIDGFNHGGVSVMSPVPDPILPLHADIAKILCL